MKSVDEGRGGGRREERGRVKSVDEGRGGGRRK